MRRRARECEIALDGRPVAAASPLHGVATFLDGVRLEAAAMPAPTPHPALAAIFDGRRVLRPIPSTSAVVRPRATWRLRPVAALLAAASVTFGGLATAGALPGPAQRASARLGTHLGIRLPGTPPPAPTTEPATPRAAPTSSPPVASTTTTTRAPQTTTTSVPVGDRATPTPPAREPAGPSGSAPTALPIPDLHAPIEPTGLRLPVEELPRPTFRR
jgi:hypothetical protein